MNTIPGALPHTNVKTGEMTPRDYGVLFYQRRAPGIFMSPMKQALGQLLLESPSQLQDRIAEFAASRRESAPLTEERFRNGVKRKERGTDILSNDWRLAVHNVRRYGNKFTADVHSKGEQTSYQASLTISTSVPHQRTPGELTIADAYCSCDDHHWGLVKGIVTLCTHASALEVALAEDQASGKNATLNITGLLPKARAGASGLPFHLWTPAENYSKGPHLRLTELLMEYYVDGKSQYAIDRAVLDDPTIYGSAIKAAITEGKAAFIVVPQKEQRKRRDEMTETQRRIYAAGRALTNRMVGRLIERGFRNDDEALEFKGTQFETVARRYRNGDEIYAICANGEDPPIAVHRFLGSRVEEWWNSAETHPQAEVSPFRRTPYVSVDDKTRREGQTEIIIPGRRQGAKFFVPKLLQEEYALRTE